ncbi:hypothetical protein PtB15_5B178 [Puccinia triticina]|nr:hypothetical protein PtB15_5B178 [Puccinia triticina]
MVHLDRAGRFLVDVAAFYPSEFLGELDIINRELKPENLLLILKGYLKLPNFARAKRLLKE